MKTFVSAFSVSSSLCFFSKEYALRGNPNVLSCRRGVGTRTIPLAGTFLKKSSRTMQNSWHRD